MFWFGRWKMQQLMQKNLDIKDGYHSLTAGDDPTAAPSIADGPDDRALIYWRPRRPRPLPRPRPATPSLPRARPRPLAWPRAQGTAWRAAWRGCTIRWPCSVGRTHWGWWVEASWRWAAGQPWGCRSWLFLTRILLLLSSIKIGKQ